MTGLTTRENDFVKNMIMTSTHDYLMFFTNTGKAHKIKAYEIPEATRTAKGTPAVNFLNLMQRERITAVIPIQEFAEDKYLIAVTKQGTIKKTALSQFDTNRKTGLIAMNLKDGDELTVGNMTLHILYTPGHTKGGISIYVNGHVFSGDTLFRYSIGRTDFYGGDFRVLMNSIKDKLFLLPDDTVVLPGHMGFTTIGDEKKGNPFV